MTGAVDVTTLKAHFAGELGAFTVDARFAFPACGITALVGASGSGKTTVLRCIAGLERLGFGEFEINGQTWQGRGQFLPPHRRRVGYVFQDANLFQHLSVFDNLTFGAKRATKGGDGPGVDFDALVALLGINHLLDRRPGRLSGGERQRVGIGRALLARPDILLMDEPLSALDPASKAEILPYLERLHETLSIPALYVTHAPEEAARLSDHLVLMEAGKVIANGPITETLARLDLPIGHVEHAGVAFDAVIKERDPDWHLARADFPGGSIWTRDPGHPVGTNVRVRVQARDVSIASNHDGSVSSILNRLPATVTEIGQNGHPGVALVRVEVGTTPIVARLTARSVHDLGLKPGLAVTVQIKSVAVLG